MNINHFTATGIVFNSSKADRIMILYSNKSKNLKKNDGLFEYPDDKIIFLYIAKNRRGPIKTANLIFNYRIKRIDKFT